ncbi:MAG: glycosyltransferase [Candidatus Brocadia sp.]|nr:MAG: glycosyltransferase [Candidatus Brocadia sp.]
MDSKATEIEKTLGNTGEISIWKYQEVPLVSVVIPCYNQADFLAGAIKSARNQTYRHAEVIVVDDGSSDRTRDVALGFSDIRYIRQENQGLSAARNAGMRESRGHYIVFLDADDRLLPIALESGLKCLREHQECAFVFGSHKRIKSNGFFNQDLGTSLFRQMNYLRQHCSQNNHYHALLQRNYIEMHASVMYRNDVLKAAGGFNTSLKACEDYDLYLRIARNYPICFHDDVVAEYWQHDLNMSKNNELMLRSVLTVLQSQWKYVNENKKYIKAYRAGLKYYTEYYGIPLLKEVKKQLFVREERMHALRRMTTLIRYIPGIFAVCLVKKAKHLISKALKYLLPAFVFQRLHPTQASSVTIPPLGKVNFGDLHCLTPIQSECGSNLKTAIDRHFMSEFLARYAIDIQGSVLEIGSEVHATSLGGTEIKKSEMIHVKDANSDARVDTIDLINADRLSSNTYDCIIIPHQLQSIYEMKEALVTLYRILKPGGVLLATLPGISKKGKDEQSQKRLWSFTMLSARRLFEEIFPASHLTVESFGNVFAAVALMHGLRTTDLRPEELVYNDPLYQIVITVRVVKP